MQFLTKSARLKNAEGGQSFGQMYGCQTTSRAGMSALVRDICLCFGQSGSQGLL